jgi:fatty acid desaturase
VFCFHYHAEHHLYVGIPYNQLRQAHSLLQSSMYTAEDSQHPRYELYQRGYFQLLYHWFRGLPL